MFCFASLLFLLLSVFLVDVAELPGRTREILFCFHVFIVHYASLTHRTGTRVAHARGINAGQGRAGQSRLNGFASNGNISLV